MLAPLEPGIRVVTVQQPLTDAEYERLAEVMAARPEVILAIPHRFGERGSHDLEFLRFFPWLSRLQMWAGSMHDLSGLRHLTHRARAIMASFHFRALNDAPPIIAPIESAGVSIAVMTRPPRMLQLTFRN
jgi:hypothetical protein